MLDPKFVRENPQQVKEALRKKRLEVDLDQYLALESQTRELQTRWEQLRAEQKRLGKDIGGLKDQEKAQALEVLAKVKGELKELESNLPKFKQERDDLADLLPSIPDPDVPEGEDDTQNVELYRIGDLPKFDFDFKDHIQLGFDHDLIDFERASKLAGSRTYFLKNQAVILDQAIQRLALDVAQEKGFTPMLTPMIVRRPAMYGTAYFPGGEDQSYHMERDASWLIGTSEVPVTSFHSGEILEENQLPLRYVGMSSCFRREAGAAGKDTKGLYRIHQFNKVEQVIVCRNDEMASKEHHQEILKNAEHVLQLLELPYRVVNVCGGDLGQGQIQKFDIETWMPSRDHYGETHSASRFYDFQARRLDLRYRDSEGNIHFCHTLNNTLIATPRILIPLLEIHQQADGRIQLPKALTRYTGFDTIGSQ